MRNTKLLTMLEGAVIAAVCVALSYIPLNLPNAAFDLSLGLVPLGVYALRRGALPGVAVGLVWGLLLIVLGKAYIISAGDEPKYLFYLYLQPVLEYPAAFALGGLSGLFSKPLRAALDASAVGQPGAVLDAGGTGHPGAALDAGGTSQPGAALGAGAVGQPGVALDAGGTSQPGAAGMGEGAAKAGGVGVALHYAALAGAVAACARWFVHFWAGVWFWGAYAPEGTSVYAYSGAMNGASAAANAVMLAIVLAAIAKGAPRLFRA